MIVVPMMHTHAMYVVLLILLPVHPIKLKFAYKLGKSTKLNLLIHQKVTNNNNAKQKQPGCKKV